MTRVIELWITFTAIVAKCEEPKRKGKRVVN